MNPAPAGVRIAWRSVAPGAQRRAVAWALVRELLGEAGAHARIGNPCPLCGGPHGPVRIDGAPCLAAVCYAADVAFAAVVDARRATALAIDAEPEDAVAPVGVLGPDATIRDWVRIEAALKADGRGLRVDPATVVVSEDGDGWLATVPGRARPLHGLDLAGPPGILVSAVTGAPSAAAEERGDRATP